jgi:hypothetical protein
MLWGKPILGVMDSVFYMTEMETGITVSVVALLLIMVKPVATARCFLELTVDLPNLLAVAAKMPTIRSRHGVSIHGVSIAEYSTTA